MTIVISPELQAYIDPLTPEEHAALERSLLAEGCRDALVLWGDVLVDGHNRYGICQKHSLPFQTVQNPRFQSLEDVHLWMIEQHLGRRSVSDFQRGVLALRQREIVAQRRARERKASEPTAPAAATPTAPESPTAPPTADTSGTAARDSREAVARAARLSSHQVVMIEKIRKQADPAVVAAVKAGSLSLSAAAAVSTLPADEQAAAAAAGRQELQQAARRAREARRKLRPATETQTHSPSPDTANEPPSGSTASELDALHQRIAELTAENAALRRQLAQWQAEHPGISQSTGAF